ncbi:MAG: hypothetical protein ABEJ65_00040 [bacterium]
MLPIFNPSTGGSQSPIQQPSSEGQSSSGSNGSGEQRSSDSEKSSSSSNNVKLDLSGPGGQSVNRKTASLVVESKVRMSIQTTFSAQAKGEQTPSPQPGNSNFFNPENTANRLSDFAKSFVEKGDGSKQENLEKVKEAVDSGFSEAKNELGGNLSNPVAILFEKIQTSLKEALSELEPENEASAQSESSDNVAQDIARENQRAAQSPESIPSSLLQTGQALT